MNGFNLSNISSLYYGSNKCSAIYKGSTLIFRDYSTEYLTFESLEDNNVIGWKKSGADAPTGTIQYSTDKTTWTSVTPDTTGVTLATLNTGDKLYLRGNNNRYDNYVNSTHVYNYFTSSKTFNIYGNIMSLINTSTFKTLTSFTANNVFYSLFTETKVVNASNLILPVLDFGTSQATYSNMFKGCTSLTSAPQLPATTLVINCYHNMFQGCTSLTTAPVLPATTLADSCYYIMFGGCKKLSYIKMLATDISATNCLYGWVNDVSSSGTFVKDASMTSLPSGDSGIPTGWTVQDAS